MDSLSFLRTGSTSPDYRSKYLPRKYDGYSASGARTRFSYSGQREYSGSPVRRTASPSLTRYGADRNLSFDRSSSNMYDSLSTSRSRDRSRRLSLAGSYSPTSYTANTSFSRSRDYSPLSPSSYNRHSYIYERKTPTDFLEKWNSRPTYTSNLSSPTYSSRINITPTHLNLGSSYGRSYSSSDAYNSNESAYLKGLKKSSYVSGYLPPYVNPLRRDTSMPTYSRYSSSPGYYSSFSSQPRSKSMSRFSHQTLTSSDSIDRDEPFSSKFYKVLNRYGNDIYDSKSLRDSMDYSSYKKFSDLDYKKIGDYSESSSRYKRYDQPKKTARELFNDLYDDLTDNTREKDWLGRAKNEYGKHQRRLSTLLMSYNDAPTTNNNTLTVPDTLEATFTSTSRRSSPRGSIATPIIKIEKEDADESNNYDNSADINLEILLDEKESKDLSNKELTRLLKTDNPEEVAKLLLEHGESFRPDEISTAILPSGEKALVMTQTKQTAVGEDGIRRRSISPGLVTSSSQSNLLSPSYYDQNSLLPDHDQEWANEEIEKFTQLTGEFEESLQTLEHFIAKNRSLFPENIIIYQKIVYHKSSAGDVAKQGLPASRRFSFVDDKDVCAVKVREKLVLPHGCRKNGYDVLEMLRRCYPRFEEIEVVYDDEENIKETLLKQENGQLDPFDDDFDQPVSRPSRSKAYNYEIDVDSGRYSPALSDDDDDLLQKCRKGDEGLPYFVTRPKSQTTMPGQPVRFTCSVAGNPEPEVQWYKDGLPLPKDTRFAAMNNFGICSLRICPTRADDKGLYTVEIENSVGSVSADVELDILSTGQHRLVHSLAFTRIPPYYVHMSEGDPLTLRCTLQGEVKPKVTWYKGSKEIRADDKYRLVAESDWQYLLQIRDLESSDTALYTVRADDGISSVKHSVEVNVAPKRDIDDTITEYEIVKKMGPIKMAPVFIKELPLQYRIKEGSNLLIGCEVDESDPQPHVVGVEIVEKKRKRNEGKDFMAFDQSTPYTNLSVSPEPWVKKDNALLPPVEC